MKRTWVFSVMLVTGVGVGFACGGVGDLIIEPGDGGSCASGQRVSSGGEDDEGPNMAPGHACIACHSRGEGPRFSIAGTVFVDSHVSNDCQPTAAEAAALGPAQVVITDSHQQIFTLGVTSDGNFSRRSSSSPDVVFPITAKVVHMGKERAMLTPQMSGDCNGCHTVQGMSGAPGRIALPN